MTTPGQLADTLSQVLGMKPGTVHFYGQSLRDAGLLSKGGRGRSAVSVTENDAINWLVAMCAAETAKSAPSVVKSTLTTPKYNERWLKGRVEDSSNPHGQLSFLDATNVGELLRFLLNDEKAHRLGPVLISLDFHVGGGHVELNAAGVDGDRSGLIWVMEMKFIRTLESAGGAIRHRDPEETPITAARETINRISRRALEEINETLATSNEMDADT